MRHQHTTNDDDFKIINGKKCLWPLGRVIASSTLMKNHTEQRQ
jgi:hypothetical protein